MPDTNTNLRLNKKKLNLRKQFKKKKKIMLYKSGWILQLLFVKIRHNTIFNVDNFFNFLIKITSVCSK